jgi:hypothetical protein
MLIDIDIPPRGVNRIVRPRLAARRRTVIMREPVQRRPVA